MLDAEIKTAIAEMKNNKAAGADGIPAEFWKNLGDGAMKELANLCKDMYEQGVWPKDFKRIVMVPLQKKVNAVDCEDYRTISLISYASKIHLRILTKRIENKVKDYIGENQFGFRKGQGTREAIGVMRTICERSLEHNNDVFICFVDFEKAFDRVDWKKMMQILKQINVDWKDRRMIKELYMGQEAVIRVGDTESEPDIAGRVRQGCPQSVLLFSIYSEMMMAEALEDVEEGVKVGGKLIKDIKFADDQGIIASTEKGLQQLMDQLNSTAKDYNMKLNVKKTKTMLVSRKEGGIVNIVIDGQLM